MLVVSCLVESQGKSVLVGGLNGKSAASFAFIKASQDRAGDKRCSARDVACRDG